MPSGTIATGGQPQPLVGPDTYRNGLWVQNNSAADLRIIEGGADAGAASGMLLQAGMYYETAPSRRALGSWSIWGGTTGQVFEYGTW